MLASTVPTAQVYDPAFAYESAAIIRDGIRRMHGSEPEDLLYYIALYNENYVMPARPEGLTDEEIVRGLYRFRAAPELPAGAPRATILSGGSIMQQALEAQTVLAERYGVAADVWSATSYQLLRNEALDVDRWNLLHPGQTPRVPGGQPAAG